MNPGSHDEQANLETVLETDPIVAATALRAGRLVAFPTETVYGLGADAFDSDAIRAVFRAKERPADNPLIAHIAHRDQVSLLAAKIPGMANRFMDAFFPGPLTLVLPAHPSLPRALTAGLETVGVRMPDHPVAQAFLDACDRPVAAPSANRSGRPSPTTWNAVEEDLGGRVDVILKGGPSRVGLESTVLDCTGPVPEILRPGSITLQDLRSIVPETQRSETVGHLNRSPGTRHRHYRPHADVVLVTSPAGGHGLPSSAGYIGLEEPKDGAYAVQRVVGDVESYARELFHFFRQCEQERCDRIDCQIVLDDGIGSALMDRLRRASGM